MCFNSDRTVRLVFVLTGSLKFEQANDPVRLITSKQYACLPFDKSFSLTGQDEGSRAVVLSLSRGIGFCEGDILGASASGDTVIPADPIPSLSLHPAIGALLESLFVVPELAECARYHRIKATELFLLIKALYTPTELAYFFQPMMSPEDHFRTFVCNNYERARSVAELGGLGRNESVGLQAPLCRVFQRQRLPLDDAAEGTPDSDRHSGRGAEYPCFDEKIRFSLLHAVQSFLQELPAGDSGPVDRRVAPSLMLRARYCLRLFIYRCCPFSESPIWRLGIICADCGWKL